MGAHPGLALALLGGLLAAPAAGQELDELLARIESRDTDIRREAARDLGRLGNDEAVTALVETATDPDRRVRQEVLSALSGIRRPVVIPGLLPYLDREEKEDRERAVRALVQVHGVEPPPGRRTRAMNWLLRRDDEFLLDPLRPVSEEVVEGLIGRLADPERDIRQAAAEGLGRLRATGAVPALVVASADAEDRVARAAVEALGEVGHVAPEAAGNALLDLVDDPRHALEALAGIGLMAWADAGPTLLEIYDSEAEGEVGKGALWALSRIGYPGALGTFIAELASGDSERRASAAAGIGRIGNRDMVDGMVRDFLREGDRRVQLAYCFALVRLGETPFVDRLVMELTDRSLGDQARDYALELGEPAVDEFARYLDDPDKDMRMRVIALLERIGSTAAIPALERREQDSETEVADRARQAVHRLRQLEAAGVEPRRGPSAGI